MSARQDILELRERGVSVPEIARRLDLAPATVRYHVARIELPPDERPAAAAAGVRTSRDTRGRVSALLDAGWSRAEIARRLGVSKATVTYHVRQLSRTVDDRCARRYDWAAIQRYYDEGHSVRDCIAAFGFSSASWYEAVKRGAVTARLGRIAISELLVADTYRGRFNLKERLLGEGLKDGRCEVCGLREWQGLPLTLALHHVNGVRNDNRLENLQLLCPNCHSQTDNFAGRNRPPPPR